jgi:hypothetical protein
MKMNNYNDNIGTTCCPTPIFEGEACEPIIEPMNVIVDGIVLTTERALEMVYKINSHLFGLGEPIDKEKFNPKCFRDVMTKQRKDMNELCVELDRIIQMFGI